MTRSILVVMLAALVTRADAAVVAAAGYAVHTIATPGTTAGGVVRRAGALLVGQGTFGAGMESIVRVDGAGTTTIATGFNALGGFDLDAAGTLWTVDNCAECPGAVTGDTVYTIPDALTRTTAVTAAGREVVDPNTIHFAADVFVLPNGTALVSDAAGAGAGRVVAVSAGTATDLITGLDFVGGVALAPDGTMRVLDSVLNPDFTTTGAVLKYGTDGAPLGTLVGGLPGALAAAFDGDGNLLVSGVGSFGASRLVAVDPNGSVTDRASGFTFSGDVFYDAARDEALVLDFGATDVFAICRDRDGDGVCDVDDDCPAIANAGQADADGDGIGDACDPCTGPVVQKAKLAVGKIGAPAGDETLAFRGVLALPADAAIDPTTTGLRVIVGDAAAVLVDATLPGGPLDETTGTGWKARNGSFKYQNPAGVLGIRKAALKASRKVPGRVSFAIAGKEGSYAVQSAALPLHATVVLDQAGGLCGDARFTAPTSGCALKKKGTAVSCR
jgi:hypothetical protein